MNLLAERFAVDKLHCDVVRAVTLARFRRRALCWDDSTPPPTLLRE